MNGAILTLARMVRAVSGLPPLEVAKLTARDVSYGRFGPMPDTWVTWDVVVGAGSASSAETARITANLTEITAATMQAADLLRGFEGDRGALLHEVTQCSPSPFRFLATFCGWSREDLARRLALPVAAVKRLQGSGWRSVRGVDHVEALAQLGTDLGEFLAAHEAERSRRRREDAWLDRLRVA